MHLLGSRLRCIQRQILISLELTVVADDEPLFVRALAWVALCMVWGGYAL